MGKTCLKIQLLDNSIHSFNYSKRAQNKLLWVMTSTIKHSVDSSVVERLMITTQNNLLTRGRPESAATVQQFHKAAEPLPHSRKLHLWTTTFSDAKKKTKKMLLNQTKCQHEDLKPPDNRRPQQNSNTTITEPLTQQTTLWRLHFPTHLSDIPPQIKARSVTVQLLWHGYLWNAFWTPPRGRRQ